MVMVELAIFVTIDIKDHLLCYVARYVYKTHETFVNTLHITFRNKCRGPAAACKKPRLSQRRRGILRFPGEIYRSFHEARSKINGLTR